MLKFLIPSPLANHLNASIPLVVLALFLTVYLFRQKYQKGLNKYPGPFLASLTNYWRLLDVWNRNTHVTFQIVHQKYGDVVRVAPRVLSFGHPDAITDIYGLDKGFTKSGYYDVFAAVNKGNVVHNLFSTRSEDFHAKLRRSVSHAFALSTLLQYEPLVDSCTSYFLDRTQELFAGTGRLCSFSIWLQYFAFDVIGELTWSQRLGFVKENNDVSNIIASVNSFQNYGAVIGQNPWLDRLVKNPVKLFLESKRLWPLSPNAAIINFALERQHEARAPDLDQATAGGARGVNFLERFLQSRGKSPEFLTDDRITAMCASLITAGSDSTAISLSKIDEADTAGTLSSSRNTTGAGDVVPFAAANKLPYLDAVICEAFRMHPAVGLLLERVTPPQGVTIHGHFVPGGIVVGCNAWVVHQNKEVFGEDADIYRPERWLPSQGANPERVSKMRQCMLQFGAGSPTCIGKNISLMETYKMIPSMLRKFEIELVESEKQMHLKNAFFVHRLNFNVRITVRGIREEIGLSS